jgi:hypothetical protein
VAGGYGLEPAGPASDRAVLLAVRPWRAPSVA